MSAPKIPSKTLSRSKCPAVCPVQSVLSMCQNSTAHSLLLMLLLPLDSIYKPWNSTHTLSRHPKWTETKVMHFFHLVFLQKRHRAKLCDELTVLNYIISTVAERQQREKWNNFEQQILIIHSRVFPSLSITFFVCVCVFIFWITSWTLGWTASPDRAHRIWSQFDLFDVFILRACIHMKFGWLCRPWPTICGAGMKNWLFAPRKPGHMRTFGSGRHSNYAGSRCSLKSIAPKPNRGLYRSPPKHIQSLTCITMESELFGAD